MKNRIFRSFVLIFVVVLILGNNQRVETSAQTDYTNATDLSVEIEDIDLDARVAYEKMGFTENVLKVNCIGDDICEVEKITISGLVRYSQNNTI